MRNARSPVPRSTSSACRTRSERRSYSGAMPTTLYRRGKGPHPDHPAPPPSSWAPTAGSPGSATRPVPTATATPSTPWSTSTAALVLPAFVDAHVHLSHTGMGLRGVDLGGTTSVVEALRAVEDAVRRRGGRPVFALNWQEQDWAEGRRDDRGRARPRELRRGRLRLTHRRPLRRGLQRARRRSPGPTGSTGGRAAGFVTREAKNAARAAFDAARSPAQRREDVEEALGLAAARGIALLHECGGPLLTSAEDFADVLDLGRRPDLPRHRRLLGRGRHRPRAGPGPRRAARRRRPRRRPQRRRVDRLAHRTPAQPLRRRRAVHRHVVPLERPRCATTSPRARSPGCRAGSTSSATPAWTPCSRATRRPPRSSASTPCAPRGPGSSTPRWSTRGRCGGWRASAWSPASSPPSTRSGAAPTGCTPNGSGASACPARTPSRRCGPQGVRLALGSDSPVTPFDPWAAVRAAVRHHDSAQRLDVADRRGGAHGRRLGRRPRGRGRGAAGRSASDPLGVGRARCRCRRPAARGGGLGPAALPADAARRRPAVPRLTGQVTVVGRGRVGGGGRLARPPASTDPVAIRPWRRKCSRRRW